MQSLLALSGLRAFLSLTKLNSRGEILLLCFKIKADYTIQCILLVAIIEMNGTVDSIFLRQPILYNSKSHLKFHQHFSLERKRFLFN